MSTMFYFDWSFVDSLFNLRFVRDGRETLFPTIGVDAGLGEGGLEGVRAPQNLYKYWLSIAAQMSAAKAQAFVGGSYTHRHG